MRSEATSLPPAPGRPRRAIAGWIAAGIGVLAVGLLIGYAVWMTMPAHAQAPTTEDPAAEDPTIEAQALAIERSLFCPQCTGIRLDVCELQICVDMRRDIREQLAAGARPDDVILYFTQRYGDRIRYELPREGINLVLFGWVGGSLLLVAAIGGTVLWRLRHTAEPQPSSAADGGDDRWLDEQLRDAAWETSTEPGRPPGEER